MLKHEWQAIFKHKFFILVMLALALVPAIYNGIFLGSMWDPYGNLDKLPVAIVNQDKAAELEGNKIEVGQSVIDQMKETKELDYRFVSEKDADKGLDSGKYYMKVVFPEDLSANAATLVTNDPKQVKITYDTSAGHNYISSKMSESAMTKLQAKVAKEITQKYTEEIFNKLSSMKPKMQQAADGSKELADGTTTAKSGTKDLSDGSKEVTSNLLKLASSTVDFQNGANKLQVGLSQYLDGVKLADDGSAQLVSGLGTLQAGLQQMANETAVPADKAAQLAQLQAGIDQMNAAIQGAATNSETSAALTADLVNVQTVLQQQLVQKQVAAVNSIPDLTPAQKKEVAGAILTSADPDLQSVKASLLDIQTQLGAMSKQTSNLAASANVALPAAKGAISELSSGLAKVNGALNSQLLPGVNELSAGAQKLNSGLDQLQAKSAELGAGSSQLASGSSQIASGSSQLAEGSQKLNSGLLDLGTGVDKLQSGSSELSTKLGDASTKLKATSSNKENADAIASPITIKHIDNDNVKTNGAGMTPYMVNVALFVGALATNAVIGIGFSGKRWKTGKEFMLAKIGTNGVIAFLQAVIVYLAVLALGLDASYPGRTFFGIVLISFAYMAINTFFQAWLGNVGKFMMLLLLVFQLATSAGTYPIQLTNNFYQGISPFLPMTYGLKLLRESIGLTGNVWLHMLFFAMVTFVFTFMLKFFKKMSRFS